MLSFFTSKTRRLTKFSPYFFSTVKLSNGRSLTFPFNFSGYSKNIDSQQSEIFDVALEHVYELDVKEGFKFAYKTTLEALEQKDIEFFKDICEPKLYKEIARGFDSIEDLGLTLEGEDLDTDSIKLTVDSFTMIYGVKHVRSDNLDESEYTKRAMNFNGLDMEIYQSKQMNPMYLMNLYPFLQIGCTFASSANILLKDSNGEIVAGHNSNGSHRFIFEGVNESQGDGVNHIQNLAQSMSGLFGAVGLFANKGAMKNFIQKIFVTKDLTWKIVDIDNHLKGNPFSA